MGEKPKIKIYTDGACSGNPGPGGWGVVLIYDAQYPNDLFGDIGPGSLITLSGYDPQTTNNKMEITAAIEGLKALKTISKDPNYSVEIITDSKYLLQSMTELIEGWIKQNWRIGTKKAVKNKELFEELYALCQNHTITWTWVKAHNGDFYNEEADRLATTATALHRALLDGE